MSRHLNQPDGPFRVSPHPAVVGRERELRRLADAVRVLNELSCTHVADAGTTTRLAEAVEAVNNRMAPLVPNPLPPRYLHPDELPLHERHPHDGSQFDYVIGLYNPLALPVEMEQSDGGRVLGRARFTTPYEGPPGCVHGAVIAACFDQVMVLAMMATGMGGPTVHLEYDFKRPTPLHSEVVFEAWADRVDGRKIFVEGRLLVDGEVSAIAHGVFVDLDREGVERLRYGRPTSTSPSNDRPTNDQETP